MWDAMIYLLGHLIQDSNQISLYLGEIKFSQRIGARKFLKNIFQLGNGYYPNGIYTTSVIRSNNNKYILAKLSDKTANQNEFGLVRGVLFKDEGDTKNSIDIFDALARESYEELNITKILLQIWSYDSLFARKI